MFASARGCPKKVFVAAGGTGDSCEDCIIPGYPHSLGTILLHRFRAVRHARHGAFRPLVQFSGKLEPVPERVHADVAQLVAHNLAKVRVASSSLVIRSSERVPSGNPGDFLSIWWRGRAARHRPAKPFTRVRIPSPPPHSQSFRAIGAAVARFPDTEEVTGSIPVSPTRM